MKDEEIIECLQGVRGIGVWTAEMLLIFHLGRPDVLPVGDLGVLKGFRIAYGLKATVDARLGLRLFLLRKVPEQE